mmetsp:Transcript_16895/g.47109  ORF Transcript_16895/g.47109 Transcript_16895/m.47109 type:complete len:94 (-) Transcript_16895:330-611(-)
MRQDTAQFEARASQGMSWQRKVAPDLRRAGPRVESGHALAPAAEDELDKTNKHTHPANDPCEKAPNAEPTIRVDQEDVSAAKQIEKGSAEPVA